MVLGGSDPGSDKCGSGSFLVPVEVDGNCDEDSTFSTVEILAAVDADL